MVTLEIKNTIAFVTLNRPDKLNALNMPMFKQLDSTIKSLRKNRQVRAVIVSGSGASFCSGLDIKAIMNSPSNVIRLLFKWLPWQANLAQRVSYGWRQLPVPVIFAIHGHCYGGGLQIALGGDYRIASSDAHFSIMEGKWGLIPDMAGNAPLSELMPYDQALKLAMTADVIDAKQARSFNLISEVANNPLQQAIDLAKRLIERSPDTVAANKRLYRRCWHSGKGRWLMLESIYQIKNMLGKNMKIAIKRQQQKDAKQEVSDEYQPRMRW
ncbi:crotonase/enoyl-CoA hydratase family protein [Thalassotalea maritima]|uniref:crotonase/enoyl-CoA hydratase family protein n=1 Tax=Thalassotalea maritima TaxID=3242416 RepID=UPI003529C75A